MRGREAWYLARPITLRSLVQIQSPQQSPLFLSGLCCLGKKAKQFMSLYPTKNKKHPKGRFLFFTGSTGFPYGPALAVFAFRYYAWRLSTSNKNIAPGFESRRKPSSWLSLPKKIKPPKRRLNFFGVNGIRTRDLCLDRAAC